MTSPLRAAMQWMHQVAEATHQVRPKAGEFEWLLLQSLYTHRERLGMLRSLGVGARVLDVGAGTGALSLDFAWLLGKNAQVTAVDQSEACLELLREMAERLGTPVRRVTASAYDLPLGAASQDLTVARYLFQHLQQPEQALREMIRVTAPGGQVAVIAVDDETVVSEVPIEPALQLLYDAIDALQTRRGGNRRIGRQLYRIMREAGLADLQVQPMPRVRLGTYHGRNPELEEFQHLYLGIYKQDLLAAGLITEKGFTDAMAALNRSFGKDRFEFRCEYLAMGRVPVERARGAQ